MYSIGSIRDSFQLAKGCLGLGHHSSYCLYSYRAPCKSMSYIRELVSDNSVGRFTRRSICCIPDSLRLGVGRRGSLWLLAGRYL